MILAADWQMLGSLADWTTTLVAVAAGAVAYQAYRKTSETNDAQQKTLELQRKQFEDVQAKAKRSQAEKVSFWLDLERETVYVVNASDLPIYLVMISIGGSRKNTPFSQVVVPTGTEPIAFPLELPSDRPLTVVYSSELDNELHMGFNDAAGQRWIRAESGDLRMSMPEHLLKSDVTD